MFVGRRGFKERLSKGAQVEAAAADEQRETAARLDLFDLLQRVARPVGGGVVDFGRDEVNQVMRHAATLFGRKFGRRNLNLTVDLNRVAVDYLAAKTERERES